MLVQWGGLPWNFVRKLTDNPALRDLGVLLIPAAALLLIHTLTNGQYGFHRDELLTLDNARHLDWGFVSYPPLTPAIGRVALALFGTSLIGFRFFAGVAVSVAMVLAGLIAREFGGSRRAQVLAVLAVGIAPIALAEGALFQYVSFDYLWRLLVIYFVVRLVNTRGPRWWLAIGAAIGLGMQTRYTMAFCVAGMAGGMILTKARRYLLSPWLYIGAVAAVLIFTPNLIWQMQHQFITLDFLNSIHARDIHIGRTTGFLKEQWIVCANPFTLPLWCAGLYYLFFHNEGKKFRWLGWMYVITMGLFVIANARSYYSGPLYPMLLAGGSVLWERWVARMRTLASRVAQGITWTALAGGAALAAVFAMPIVPVNSALWAIAGKNYDLREEIGWPDLVATVGGVYHSLPAGERGHTGILAGNYGEAGAIDLYGPAQGLPRAISGVNSYWLRGYGQPAPRAVIVVGFSEAFVKRNFRKYELVAHVTNRYGVENEESHDHPDIFLCRDLLQPWPEFWKTFRYFG